MKTLTLAHATRRIFLAAAVATTATLNTQADYWDWVGKRSGESYFDDYSNAKGTKGSWYHSVDSGSTDKFSQDNHNFANNGTGGRPTYASGWDKVVTFRASTSMTGAINLEAAGTITFVAKDQNSAHGINSTNLLKLNSGANLAITSGTYKFSKINVASGSTAGESSLTVNGGTVDLTGDLVFGPDDIAGASGTLNLNGGTVKVAKWTKSFYGTGTINLNGGTLETKVVTDDNQSGSMTVNFNGGTLKANTEYNDGLIWHRSGGGGITVNVNAGGGTIDSGNYAISIPVALSGTGGMTFKGGNTITLSGSIGWTGGTTIAAGTTVNVATATQKDALLGSEQKTLKVIPVTGTHMLMAITGEDTFTDDDLSKVSLADGYNADAEFSISGDGKSLNVTISNIDLSYGGQISQSSPTLVFPGVTLADLDAYTLRARMQGSQFNDDGVEASFFNRDETLDGDVLTKVTYQLQAIDGEYVKAAKVEFTADASGVYAKLIDGNYANYGDLTTFGTDLSSNPKTNKYIPYDLKLVEPANAISVNFCYNANELGTSSTSRIGAGDYAVPYTSWNNMTVSAGSSATFGGATFKQTTTSGRYRCNELNPSTDLRYGYLDDSGNTVVIDVTDIPYEFYRIVTYHATDVADIKFGYVTINGIDYTGTTDATVKGNAAWGATAALYKANGLREGVNYLVSDLMVASSATITGHRSGTTYRGCIAAIQIVESSLPTYTATIDDGGEKTFSALAWETALPALLTTGDQLVVNVNENTTLTFDYDVNVYAVKFNVASGKTLTLAGGTLASQNIVVTGGGSLTLNNDVDAPKIAFTNSSTLTINADKTLTTEDISGNVTVSNDGTLVKSGTGTASWSFNISKTGTTVVSGGTLKMKSLSGSGTGYTVRVKNGATFDVNGVAEATVNVILEEGAKFANTGDEIEKNTKQTVKITLEGDATAQLSSNCGLINQSYGKTYLELGGNTFTIDGSGGKRFWLANTTVTGTGKIYLSGGYLRCSNSDVVGNDCTVHITSGGALLLDGVNLTVANFVNESEYDVNRFGETGTLMVKGTLTSRTTKAIPKLTLASGATVKATGTAQTVSTTFSASGTVYIDASNIPADTIRAGNVPVLTVLAGAATGNVTWRVKDSQLAGALAKWFEDEGGTTKTLYLCKPTGLMVIFR